MNNWEQHKPLLAVIGGFFGLLLLLWLVFLRGNAYAVADHVDTFEGKASSREKLCPEQGTQIRFLTLMFENANDKLLARRSDLIQKLSYDFSGAAIPPDELRNRQVYVRNKLYTLQQYAVRELETNRRIQISEDARGLGFDLPEEYSEDLKQDEIWMRQMAAVRRVIDRMMQVHKEPNGTTNILRLESITPEEPVTAEAPCRFIEEYPVTLVAWMRVRGIMNLVASCSRPGDWLVVRSMEVDSAPQQRLSLQLNDKEHAVSEKQEKYNRWYSHYYRVRLTLATPLLGDPEESDEEEKKKPTRSGAAIRAIPH